MQHKAANSDILARKLVSLVQRATPEEIGRALVGTNIKRLINRHKVLKANKEAAK